MSFLCDFFIDHVIVVPRISCELS